MRKSFIAALWLAFILMVFALVFPWNPSLKINSRTAQAKNDSLQLKNAISSYFTEYERYPIRSADGSSKERSTRSDHSLMDILLASEKEGRADGMNPLRIPFYVGAAAKPMKEGRFRRGVTLDDQGGGELWDPWGNHYRVVMDTDGDGRVQAPEWFTDSDYLPHGVIVWSPGPDGDDATAEDNVVSWPFDD